MFIKVCQFLSFALLTQVFVPCALFAAAAPLPVHETISSIEELGKRLFTQGDAEDDLKDTVFFIDLYNGLVRKDRTRLRRSSEESPRLLNQLRQRGGKVVLLAGGEEKESLVRDLAEICIFPPRMSSQADGLLASWGQYDELLMLGASTASSCFENSRIKKYLNPCKNAYLIGGYTDDLKASVASLARQIDPAKIHPFYVGPQHNRCVDSAGSPLFPTDLLENIEKLKLLDGGTGTAYSFEKNQPDPKLS